MYIVKHTDRWIDKYIHALIGAFIDRCISRKINSGNEIGKGIVRIQKDEENKGLSVIK